MDCDLVETSAHGGARPEHALWQGKVYHIGGAVTLDGVQYRDFVSATGYGSGPGLCGWNCRHNFYPYYPGLSRRVYGDDELAKLNARKIEYNGKKYTQYEIDQMQRAGERKVRKLKRQFLSEDAAGLPSGSTAVKLKQAREKLAEFCKQTGNRLDSSRIGVGGFGRSAASSASWAARRADELILNPENDIMKSMKNVDISIDKFTPCLENAKTGELVSTSFSRASSQDLQNLKGWKFNWRAKDLSKCEIYKLTVSGNDSIQGLVAITDFSRDAAVYVNLAESSPNNLGASKQYNGVGGHLFAIAAERSVQLGHGGFIFLDAKNMQLVQHYSKALGAILIGRPHPYRMIIDETAAQRLLKLYNFEEV